MSKELKSTRRFQLSNDGTAFGIFDRSPKRETGGALACQTRVKPVRVGQGYRESLIC